MHPAAAAMSFLVRFSPVSIHTKDLPAFTINRDEKRSAFWFAGDVGEDGLLKQNIALRLIERRH